MEENCHETTVDSGYPLSSKLTIAPQALYQCENSSLDVALEKNLMVEYSETCQILESDTDESDHDPQLVTGHSFVSARSRESDSETDSSDSEHEGSRGPFENVSRRMWEIDLGGSWKRFDIDVEEAILAARKSDGRFVEYMARGQRYSIDIDAMYQTNVHTGVKRAIRCSEFCSQAAIEPKFETDSRSDRLNRLVTHLLSPAVQVPLQMAVATETAKLTPEEVRQVFVRHVPGVEHFLFRGIPGQFTLKFLVSVYQSGLQAFHGTPVGEHLLSLYRVIVHHGHEFQNNSAHLRDVAEAFLSCQAEQARVIQRVGLEIQGIRGNFQGLVERLVGEYKIMTLKMLAAERISQGKAWADKNPTHYENRLFADLGDAVGLNKDLVELAHLDGHASSRYEALEGEEHQEAVNRCRELFDIQALLDAFVAEVNALSDESSVESLPCLFLNWVSDNMVNKHIVLDDLTCSRLEVTKSLALAVLEIVFLGSIGEPEETYRGTALHDLFVR